MNAEQTRKFNTLFGASFAIAGVFAWVASIYFVVVPKEPKPVTQVQAAVDPASCRNALARMGYVTMLEGNKVNAYYGFSPDIKPREHLEKASTAILLCQATLKDFCMGNGCERSGVSFDMEFPVAKAAEKSDKKEAGKDGSKATKDGGKNDKAKPAEKKN